MSTRAAARRRARVTGSSGGRRPACGVMTSGTPNLAERRPAGRAEAQGQVEARARREEQLRALAAAVGGGEEEDASGHRGYGVGGVVSRRIGQAMAVLRITDRYNPCSSG